MPPEDGKDGIGYGHKYPIFWIDRFRPHSVKQHTGFVAMSRSQVDAFYEAALNAGGRDNGPPGLRSTEAGYPSLKRRRASRMRREPECHS